jgi:hypothetical protein
MTTMLGKGSVWQAAKRANADDGEKKSQESRFHHFQHKGATDGVRVPAIRHAGHCHFWQGYGVATDCPRRNRIIYL